MNDSASQQQTSQLLSNSEQRWRILFEYAPDACYLHDLQGTFVEGNKAAEDLVGYTRQELVGKNFFQLNLLGAEGLSLAAANLAKNAQGQPAGPDEYRLRRKNGSFVVVEIRSYPVRLGEQVLVLGIARDVSARKQAEQELRESEERLRSVWENSLDAMLLADRRGRIIDVNAAYCRLFKIPRERLIGELFTTTYHPEHADALLETHCQQLESGSVIPHRTVQARLWNSQELHLDVSSSFIELGTRGRMLVSIFRDVTERCRTESALEAAQQRLQYLLARSPAVIFALRLTGDELKPNWISNYIQPLLGFTPEECLQPDWWQHHVHPDDLAALAHRKADLLRQKQLVREYRVRNRHGDYRWIRDERRLVCDARGEPVEVLGSWVDITERKALEDLLRHSQKMEAIGLLAGGVAHDFNNLLLVMRGNAELLLMDSDQFPSGARESLRQITAAAERAANLTRQLLAFSRKQVMQPQPLNLNEVLINLAKMLKRVIGEHIELQCKYEAAPHPVLADTGMMEQVLINLVVNARDAMPNGGKLELRTRNVRLDEASARANPEARPGELVCLSVHDTGAGIAPEHLPRIFEPFFTTKAPGKGTGLGLATAYGIIKQHQGWVEVSSKPGAGTAFTIFLPALPGVAGPALVAPAEGPPPKGSESVLLVEDETAVRLITRRVLENAGYKVQEAVHAQEALELWTSQPASFDLLLTDMVMPQGMTGRELAERLRGQRPELKTLFISGYGADMAGKDTEFFRRHKSHFLQKPFSSRALLKMVRACLGEPAPRP